jgi:UDP-glucose:(heptosyl)LPS alpha-1,3-glucosyltransferase
MRIALVTKQFSESHGGVERVCVNLARGLAGRGHEVHVFAHRWDLEPEGVILHRVPMVSIFSWSKMLSFARNAKSRYEKENYDVVYVLTPALGGDIFRIGGLHRQWLAVKHPNLMIRWCFSLASPVNLANLYLENKIFSRKGYGVFVANSHMGKEHIILHYGIPADRIQVVYNGVDPEVFHPAVRQQYQAEVRGELGIPEDVPVVLFLAANWKRKGLETLLRALPEHGNYRAVVVGRERAGRYGKIVQVRGLGGKVVFSGPTTKPARFYGTADLFVLPWLAVSRSSPHGKTGHRSSSDPASTGTSSIASTTWSSCGKSFSNSCVGPIGIRSASLPLKLPMLTRRSGPPRRRSGYLRKPLNSRRVVFGVAPRL